MINSFDNIRELIMSDSCRNFNLVSLDRELACELVDWFCQNFHSISPYDDTGAKISPSHLRQKVMDLNPSESIHFSGGSILIIKHIQVFMRIEENNSVFTKITFSPRDTAMDELEASSLVRLLNTWQKILNAKIGYLRYENEDDKHGYKPNSLIYVPKDLV